jgi:HAMP domain-containing protein
MLIRVLQIFTIVATAIVAACVLFLSVNADSRTKELSSVLSFYIP